MVRARQDGKTMDKASNTKHIAQVIAQQTQGWLPIRPTDPDSQHEITQLRQQLAELRQRLGKPAEGSTPTRTGQQSSSSQMPAIQRSLQGAAAPPAPPSFDPASLLTIPGQSNSWLTDNLPKTPKGFANRTYSNWLNQLGPSQAQENTVQVNLVKKETWWPQLLELSIPSRRRPS